MHSNFTICRQRVVYYNSHSSDVNEDEQNFCTHLEKLLLFENIRDSFIFSSISIYEISLLYNFTSIVFTKHKQMRHKKLYIKQIK